MPNENFENFVMQEVIKILISPCISLFKKFSKNLSNYRPYKTHISQGLPDGD